MLKLRLASDALVFPCFIALAELTAPQLRVAVLRSHALRANLTSSTPHTVHTIIAPPLHAVKRPDFAESFASVDGRFIWGKLLLTERYLLVLIDHGEITVNDILTGRRVGRRTPELGQKLECVGWYIQPPREGYIILSYEVSTKQ